MSEQSISPELVCKIHSANIANIARKVQERKTLTASEVKQLNAAKTDARNQAIAEARKIITDGKRVMGEIKGIIDKSKLSTTEKRAVTDAIYELCKTL